MPTSVISYQEAIAQCNGTKHLLLGNGFSIGCDPVFNYPNLYETAVTNGLSQHAKQVFELIGTNNFEGVMRLLENCSKVAQIYGLVGQGDRNPFIEDLNLVKTSLISSVASNHLRFPALVSDIKKTSCANFIRPFTHTFTTNYDLLLYWVSMHDLSLTQFQDGFAPSLSDDTKLCFRTNLAQNKGILFLHGALHLYSEDGEIRKHSWTNEGKPLIELVEDGLNSSQYPIFISEGEYVKKKEQINANAYLAYCWGKLSRIENPLFIYGHSLSEHDEHITKAISENTKLKKVYVGIFGDIESSSNQSIIAKADRIKEEREQLTRGTRYRNSDIEIIFYDSESAHVWGTE